MSCRIKNPFIHDSPIEFQGTIPVDRLINEYRSRFKIDISDLLSSTDSIKLYKCTKSGYEFYTPFSIVGNSGFYEKLQKLGWYYLPWKWEHQVCYDMVDAGFRILEIGCGKGDFLRKVSRQHKDVECIGLELNQTTATSGDGLKIINSRIEDYSVDNQAAFDIVCAFQVLEHIPDVNTFLEASIHCLKNNGLLVLSVPNNESFIQYDSFNILNMPPHHMGRWKEGSLRMIADCFNLELLKIEHETLQEYHYEWYLNIMLTKKFGERVAGYISKATRLLGLRKFQLQRIQKRANEIRGHTTIAVFRKAADLTID